MTHEQFGVCSVCSNIDGEKNKRKKPAGLTMKHSFLFDPPNLPFTPSHSHPIVKGKQKKKKANKKEDKTKE